MTVDPTSAWKGQRLIAVTESMNLKFLFVRNAALNGE